MHGTSQLLIGYAFSWCLFGAFMIQLYDYARAFHEKERFRIRLAVYIASVFNVMLLCAVNLAVRGRLGGSAAESRIKPLSSLSTALIPLLGSPIACVVQMHFAWRVSILNKTMIAKAISALVVALAIIQFGAAAATAAIDIVIQHSSSSLGFRITRAIWQGTNLFCNLLISATMLYLTTKKTTRPKWWAQSINNLFFTFVQSGSITTAISIASFILLFAGRHTHLILPTQHMMGGLFANVLLSRLNGRPKALQKQLLKEYNQNDLTLRSGSQPVADSYTHRDTLDISPGALAYEKNLDFLEQSQSLA